MSRIFPATRSGLALGFGGAPIGNMYSPISDGAAQTLLRGHPCRRLRDLRHRAALRQRP